MMYSKLQAETAEKKKELQKIALAHVLTPFWGG